MSKRIRGKVTKLRKKLEVQHFQSQQDAPRTRADLIRDVDELRLSGSHPASVDNPDSVSSVSISCHSIPLPPNSSFFGREEILEDLDRQLGHDTPGSGQPRVTLWGTSGIGKSQIALSYAWKKRTDGLPIVLWINSETSLDIESSFARIACDAKLPGYSAEGANEQSRILVLRWLATTS